MRSVFHTGSIITPLMVLPYLRGPYWQKMFFYYCFYAIMHRTTIVQNKIISIICSCHFFCMANIYRPSLRKVRLGIPDPQPLQPLNFYLRRRKKKTILLRIVCTTTLQSPLFNFDFHLFFKKLLKTI